MAFIRYDKELQRMCGFTTSANYAGTTAEELLLEIVLISEIAQRSFVTFLPVQQNQYWRIAVCRCITMLALLSHYSCVARKYVDVGTSSVSDIIYYNFESLCDYACIHDKVCMILNVIKPSTHRHCCSSHRFRTSDCLSGINSSLVILLYAGRFHIIIIRE
ncbi:unnamed protein product [Litomosoides sigmodontis]|uniref:Uncharacterized protein n=1 Tax=Litomosoides sigmodontis TaxID=42156 RepID=A0A3P6TH36_LITSI|nr:unnamed protein product [Litomosoides sigmodontis]